MKKEHLIYLAVFLGGVVLANRVRAIPVVGSRIPSV